MHRPSSLTTVILALSITLAACTPAGAPGRADRSAEASYGGQGGESDTAVPETDGASGPPIDWAKSPFAGPTDIVDSAEYSAVARQLPYPAIDLTAIPGNVTIYRMGAQVAFVSTDPTLRIIQSPSETPGTEGLDASDPAYQTSASVGTQMWNMALSDGSLALVSKGKASATLLFKRGNSLIQIGAPPEELELVIETAEHIVSSGSP